MRILKSILFTALLLIMIFSCKSEKKEAPEQNEVVEKTNENIIEVIAKDFTFQVDSIIPSGWSTFNMKNIGMMEHFFFLTKLPEGKTINDYINDVGGAFGKAWIAYKNGDVDMGGAYEILGASLPEWYASATPMGGIGLISGGKTGITTMRLTPGNYVMECYIKTAEGKFHTELGMIEPIKVSDEVTKMTPPKASVEISLTNEAAEITGEIVAGKNIIAVHFKEHPKVGLGNDIHLIKLDENTNMDTATQWMDWLGLTGLTSPAPVVFLGGTHEMPVGNTAYFNCDLEPGDYAFIAETPLGRYQTFTVK